MFSEIKQCRGWRQHTILAFVVIGTLCLSSIPLLSNPRAWAAEDSGATAPDAIPNRPDTTTKNSIPQRPGLAAEKDETSPDDTLPFDWEPSADCSECHEDESASMELEGTLASVHYDVCPQCIDCHDETELTDFHGSPAQKTHTTAKLTSTEVDSCLDSGCHDLDDLVEATSDVDILEDANGTVANPHLIYQTHSDKNIHCYDCHAVHDADADVAETSQAYCQRCHHAEVYECGTCHSVE